jgi:hypothetical protein
LLDRRACGLDGVAADHRRLAQRADRGTRGLGERRQVLEELLDLAGALRDVAQRRTLLVDGRAQLGHRRAQLAQEGREPAEARGDLRVALGRGLRELLGLDDEAPDVLLVARQLADHLVGVAREIGEDLVLAGEDRQHLVGLAQGRDRAADGVVEVLGVARDGRAELGDDVAQALAVGAAQDVVDEVRRDRARGALDADHVALVELAARLAGLAVDVVLADERLRGDVARRVRAQGAEALLGDVEADDRVLGLAVEVELRDLARADAGDLEVAALDQAERVVELDLELLALLVLGRAAGEQHEAGGGRDERDDGDDAPHRCAPGKSWFGSQLKSGVGFHGFDLSGAGNSAPPGQRLRWPVAVTWAPASVRSGSGIGLTTPSMFANALR